MARKGRWVPPATPSVAWLLAGMVCAAGLPHPACAESAVTDERLAAADSEPQNWLTTLQNYSGHRYSRLDQIDTGNVERLRLAFTVPITLDLNRSTHSGLDTNPLVDEGMIYVENAGGVFAKIDARSGTGGSVVWTVDAAVAPDVPSDNRGAALINDLFVKCLRDGRVVAVDRMSGEIVWDVRRLGIDHPGGSGINIASEACTGGTVAFGGYVLVANGNGDGGTRGWVEALAAADGSPVWRTYSVPGPGQPGHDTWQDEYNAWKTGGGGMWTQGTYDPVRRVTYWGTANPVPAFDPGFRPGDNLFTASALALDIDTGRIEWFFQYIPNEGWDYDESGVHFLVDREVDGRLVPTVAHFGRNGFFYQLDRTTGRFIMADAYVDSVTWTGGLNPITGRPVEYIPGGGVQPYIPRTRLLAGEALDDNEFICPNGGGGVRWQYPAYNPDTGLAYAVGEDGCFKLAATAVHALGPDGGIDVAEGGGLFGVDFADGSLFAGHSWHGAMWAVDVATGETRARTERWINYQSGVTVTAGGLAFTSTPDGLVLAYDAASLEELWSFSTGIVSRGTPIAYAVDGREYIAVLVGGPRQGGALSLVQQGAMLFVFAL